MMCEHDWKWSYKNLQEELNLDGDLLGVNVKCQICGAEGIEWYTFSEVEVKGKGREPSAKEYAKSELRAMGGGDPNV